MSYLTHAEKLRLQAEWPHKGETIAHYNVSMSQLSIARWSMGCTIGNHRFVYIPAHDELWRDDVLALVHGWRKAGATAKVLPAQVQGELLAQRKENEA
jgi:hypothetical protein